MTTKLNCILFSGSLLINVGNVTLAKSIFEDLVNRNPENHSFYEKLLEASEAKTAEEKLALFAKYRE